MVVVVVVWRGARNVKLGAIKANGRLCVFDLAFDTAARKPSEPPPAATSVSAIQEARLSLRRLLVASLQ